jgi:hypothetical protein
MSSRSAGLLCNSDAMMILAHYEIIIYMQAARLFGYV